jgi:hypothetical protein
VAFIVETILETRAIITIIVIITTYFTNPLRLSKMFENLLLKTRKISVSRLQFPLSNNAMYSSDFAFSEIT